jgi:hypothetical protein
MPQLGAVDRADLSPLDGPPVRAVPGALVAYEAWAGSALHLLHSEVEDMCRKVIKSRDATTEVPLMTVVNSTAESAIMPYMVNDPSQRTGYALKNTFLFAVYRNYQQLDNLLACVACDRGDDQSETYRSDISLYRSVSLD